MTTAELPRSSSVRYQMVAFSLLGVVGLVCLTLFILALTGVYGCFCGDRGFLLKFGSMLSFFLGLAWILHSIARDVSTVKVSVFDDHLEICDIFKSEGTHLEESERIDYAPLVAVKLDHRGLDRGEKPHTLVFYTAEERKVGSMAITGWRKRPTGDWSRQLLRSLDLRQVPVDEDVRHLLGHELVEKSLRDGTSSDQTTRVDHHRESTPGTVYSRVPVQVIVSIYVEALISLIALVYILVKLGKGEHVSILAWAFFLIFLGSVFLSRFIYPAGAAHVAVLDQRIEHRTRKGRSLQEFDYAEIRRVTYLIANPKVSRLEQDAYLFFYGDDPEVTKSTMALQPWRSRPTGDWSRQLLRHLDEHQVSMDGDVRRLLDHDLVEKSLR